MKKIFAVLVALIVFASTAAVKACSNGEISGELTEVRLGVDPHLARAAMWIIAKDLRGEILCGISQMDFGTSRNAFAPADGWPTNVDHITVYAQNGPIALVVFTTRMPAGTTVRAEVNGRKIGIDGMPFFYNGKRVSLEDDDPLPSPPSPVDDDPLPSPSNIR